ncbi:SH3-binding, glutamic acid-rich protein-domain-containing protein [Zychaea mexicana]|uniref:SH3-binding, glutamic acid-rich protein-domain-containing protein n=1 Tax=Zychaea mexicana TaxID=64656 RepID=UPI0022FE0F8F|nr:SH3-binding, glutamic acid-rich protein-domain-containing protein [Zychaea mexicana]KAI9488894.1 SH3-binding, glutamic acid-rich protein-domain-containing protein [Zychaea mexicana]
MVCLGPRKKPAKKPALLSPDDATNRSVKGSMTKKKSLTPLTKRKSTASVASSRNSVDAPGGPNATATTGLGGKQVRRPTSRTSLARSPSPDNRPRSPHTRPPPPPGTAPSVRSSARPSSHSRNASNASTIKKSPVAQMREEFDELKVKHNENLEVIAQQKAELELLKQLVQKPAATAAAETQNKKDNDDNEPQQQPTSPPPELKPSISQLELDTLQAQNEENMTKLHDQEQLLEQREKELEDLRQRLEAEKNVPNIVVSEDESLAERERALAAKEQALEAERQKWEAEKASQNNNIDDGVAQLEKLKLENEEAVRRLADKEKELEKLRSKIENGEQQDADIAQLEQIEQLNKQLEAQKLAHEESLRRHEEAMAEKEKLLSEQQQALESLQESHNDEIRKLKTGQSSSILTMKQRHKQDMSDLQSRLQEAETKVKKSSNAAMMDDEVERILHEFEQAEHSHAVQIETLQQSHQSELTDLQQNHVAQLRNLKKVQDRSREGWTTRYLPTEAVSWPAPQPLSVLRKTNGPRTSHSASQRIMNAAKDEAGPVLIPLDNKKIQVYISTVSGNAVIKRKQEDIQQLLKTNDINFELIDVAASEAALQHMKRCNNNGSNDGRAKEVPQLFVGGEYRGQFEDVSKHVEEGTLDTLLQPAAEREWTPEERAALQKAEAARSEDPAVAPPIRVLPAGPAQTPTLRKTAGPSPGPVRAYRGIEDDDEALLKELEQELDHGIIKVEDL